MLSTGSPCREEDEAEEEERLTSISSTAALRANCGFAPASFLHRVVRGHRLRAVGGGVRSRLSQTAVVFPLKDNIPTARFPLVTVVIIALNVIVFFGFQGARLSLSGASVDEGTVIRYGAIPYEFTHPGKQCGPALLQHTDAAGRPVHAVGVVACQGERGVPGDYEPAAQPPTWLTALSSMFMQGGLLHILGNMLFLWIFGNNVEDAMGRRRFAVFYLLAGLAALGLETAVRPSSTAPTIGASGAIAGVLGAYIVLHPRARVLTLVFIVFFVTLIELPAVAVLALWFAQQVAFGALDLTNPTGGGGAVAYFAHVGGFVFGLLTVRLFARRGREQTPVGA